MNKEQVSSILEEIAVLLELKGENPFKSRAYQMGARTIRSLSEDITTLVENRDLQEVKGIGSALAEKITELVETGKLSYYDKLKKEIPQGLVDMTAISGFGPRKIRKVYDELGIKNISELEYACHENRLVDLEGFGEKSQEKILQGIEYLKQHKERHYFHHVERAALPLLDYVKEHDSVIRADLAGSLRRKKETIKDIDIVASTREADRKKVMDHFVKYEGVMEVTGQGDTKTSIILEDGLNADLRLLSDNKYAFILHHFTGSAEHNTALRSRAKKRDMKISEHGLFDANGDLIACKDEAELYAALDLAFIPPELREDFGEIEAAEDGKLPDFVTDSDIRGVLHCHSTYSDGTNTLEEMANAVREQGYDYFGICDHSEIVVYARGLTPEQVKEQHDEIDRLNEKFEDFKILKGTECDIVNDGGLDYPDDVLAMFDFVVASIHTNISMDRAQATRRLLRAIEHPLVDIIGHPTGRLLLGRDGYPLDMEQIFDAAAEHKVALELNASPYRFDLDWRLCKRAVEHDILISINPDAHSVKGLGDMRYGVGIGRKGWLKPENVLNCMTLKQIEAHFKSRREKE